MSAYHLNYNYKNYLHCTYQSTNNLYLSFIFSSTTAKCLCVVCFLSILWKFIWIIKEITALWKVMGKCWNWSIPIAEEIIAQLTFPITQLVILPQQSEISKLLPRRTCKNRRAASQQELYRSKLSTRNTWVSIDQQLFISYHMLIALLVLELALTWAWTSTIGYPFTRTFDPRSPPWIITSRRLSCVTYCAGGAWYRFPRNPCPIYSASQMIQCTRIIGMVSHPMRWPYLLVAPRKPWIRIRDSTFWPSRIERVSSKWLFEPG